MWGSLVIVHPNGSDGQRFRLRHETVTIGRDRTDICFADDRCLGGLHARVERGADGAVYVHPLESLNGVFLRLRAEAPLRSGDRLLLGQALLRFELIDEDERALAPLIQHGVTQFGVAQRPAWARLSEVLVHGGVGDVRHLREPDLTIGRQHGDWVFPDDAFLSHQHARISGSERGATVTDLDSSNGTYLRLRGRHQICVGDYLRLGDHLLRFDDER